ncbi:SurA N-terminal domain-containing protein [Halomonas heilongjiangensis]|uniref:Periplasmic chaperone PpiD n=1 Tax=Halomonas heilongjiangensis TaxID=1387883 RepID=A0A2N7TMC2_9GAMM|nr:SurA N-terminal domain-containing protein [Halomonas heilongjiangensis]PMR69329.1 peptidylprolyl isomerase [Halomonas heilongjiangensis]PXX90666.1 peptidylprolyl isomerase [Halomonas heilongjiangensis]
MLQSIRDRSRSWGAKIIIGAVVATMALFGVESLVGLFGGGGDDIAKVNGEPVTRQQLELEVQRAIRSGQVPPEQERALRNQMLDQLITDRLLTQYAEEGGLHLSEEQLDQLIVSLPEFQDQEGRFSSELFRNRLASAGYTPLAFREELRVDMKRQQLQQGLAFSDFTLPSEQERLGALQRQTRSFRHHALTAADLEADLEVTEEAMQRYYEANAENYQRPEQVRLEYVVIDRQQLADEIEVEEEALRELWQERSRDADRRISHIMLTFNGERSREEAVAELETARERLVDGEAFADLAAELSEDTVSAEQGGDLGVISRGFFGEAFEDAAFALDEGEVSDIVETDNGLHLLQATALERQPFEQVRDELRREVAMSRVSGEFNQRVQRLIDESFAADDLRSVADAIGLELHESDWASRDGADGVLSEPGVMAEAFSADVLEEGYNSEVIELDEDRRLVLRVADHREATVLELDEVRDRVRASVEARLRREALIELAAERVEQLRAGEAPEIEWQQAEAVSREAADGLPQAVLQAAFRLPAPEGEEPVFGHAVAGDRVVLIALDRVEPGEVDGEVERFVARMAERLRAQAAIQGLLDDLRDKADIERL